MRARHRRSGVALTLAGLALMLAACVQAPIPLAQAETICAAEARSAAVPESPRTRVGLGVGSGGYRGGFVSVEVPADRIVPRDPAQVFSNCVQRRSGQMPSRPLTEQPGWKAG
ncbi:MULTISPECIES: hypothetical protein [unclassified Paracoccus (in: a-proteobacteria)]|uniref:hypothetical protein n=1 Tax=unclassified Paracoccus (in: a-proteobacteria) TaxID=2688777 RepID=UPI0021E1131F|nr:MULTISPECIES: hypothetical protein [unclassified Paracoccus (in: a-proteobacteria)]UXU75274.1 hypothetical protein GB879_001855 [Paracoccus sp. SMMA_5]UXU81176.1 hypothetical protein GB880_001850 [Paracoccus sp. SMMA_5_TC]